MFEWLKRNEPQAATLKEPEWWKQSLVGSTVDAGVVVNEKTSMQLSSVFAAIRILSESIGSLPLKIYQRRSDGGKDLAVNHPLTRMFSGVPNAEQTPQELLEFIMVSALMRGTGYNEIIRDGSGNPKSLEPLNAADVSVKRDNNGQLFYDYKTENGSKILTSRNVWRVPNMGADGVTGYSILGQARQSLGVSIATERHAAKTFANGTRVPAVFEMDGHLEDEAFERLKGDLKAHAGVDSANTALLLEHGIKYHQVGMSHDDAQFLESRTFQVGEIARWFNVPLHMLSELSKSSFNNIEHQGIEFVTYSLRPWCKRIEQTITRDLITPSQRGRFFAEFTMDALLRGDTKNRYEAHQVALGTTQAPGWKSVNEVRMMENMNPVEGFDEINKPMIMESVEEEEQETDEEETENALARINAKECSAIRFEYGRLQPDEFDAWLEGFYSRMIDDLIGMGVGVDTATVWAETRQKQVLTADNILTLMDEWESK
jgi:HK97 family phage portal protein